MSVSEDASVREWDWLARTLASRFFFPGADRDDVLQEARFGLLLAVRDWDSEAGLSFRNFASLCISRNLVTALKAAQRGKHGPLNDAIRVVRIDGDDLDAVEVVESPRARDPYLVAVDNEQIAGMVAAMATLTPAERHALTGIVNGRTYAEIGPDTKQTDNALQRARKKLAA